MKANELRRSIFSSFMQMFNGQVRLIRETHDSLEGSIQWPDDEEGEESQRIRWDITLDDVPSEKCLVIMDFIHCNDLLDIDRLKISREELFLKMSNADLLIDKNEFNKLFEQILSIKILMIDKDYKKGDYCDSFFIHE